MKKNKFLETIKNKSETELIQMVKEHRENLRSLRFNLIAGKVKNASAVSSTRREIARLLTELRHRQSK